MPNAINACRKYVLLSVLQTRFRFGVFASLIEAHPSTQVFLRAAGEVFGARLYIE